MDDSAKETSSCNWCGDSFEYYPSIQRGKFCSRECSQESVSKKWKEDNPTDGRRSELVPSGEDHAMKRRENRIKLSKAHTTGEWDGIKNEANFGENWFSRRRKALERDDNECVECGDDGLVHVHHIIPRKVIEQEKSMTLEEDANDLDNLVTLCPKHHKEAEITFAGP